MTKSYTVTAPCRDPINFEMFLVDTLVNVPSPQQFEATTENGKYSVAIHNFSRDGKNEYSVVRLELETDPLKIKSGNKFNTSDFSRCYIHDFRGKNARSEVIYAAAQILVGRL